jgi:hypothetical protein
MIRGTRLCCAGRLCYRHFVFRMACLFAFLNVEIPNERWNAYFADGVMAKMPLYVFGSPCALL